jgi:hypothetical protein
VEFDRAGLSRCRIGFGTERRADHARRGRSCEREQQTDNGKRRRSRALVMPSFTR